MGNVRIAYYSVRNGRGYWQPSKVMRGAGFEPIACGLDGPAAWARAEEMNKAWRDRCDAAAIPKGSLAEAFAIYRKTPEWEKKAYRTREDWERAWRHIGPVFGDMRPASVTMGQVSKFREAVRASVSEREAHRCIKIWRALWRVAASLKYCEASADPSQGVRNTEPEKRQRVWSHIEVRRLIKTAWRAGYKGLAATMAIAWDSSLSPVDVRSLTPAQRGAGDVFALDRAKTGRAAVATLSRASSRVLDTYIAGLACEIAPDAPILRNRSGRAYSKDTLGDDFRDVRAIAFGAAETRTLADFRRSGAVEALRGGASMTQIGQKLANDVGANPALARTYTPVDLASVRAVDNARKMARK